MLTIGRKPGESLIMVLPDGSTAEVIVLGSTGNKTRFGCIADKDIKIYRKEVFERIQAEKKQKALQEQAA